MLFGTAWLFSAVVGAAPADPATPLTFDDALALAVQASGNVIRAKEDLILVDVEWKRSLSTVLPRVDMSLRAGRIFVATDVPQVGGNGVFVGRSANSNFSLNLNANQLIFDGGRWWTQLARVDDVEAANRAALSILTNDLRATVASSFYGYAMQLAATRQIEEQVQVDEDQLERSRALMKVGRGRPADVAAAARNLAEDKSSLARQRYNERQAARTLNVLIGREPEVPVRLTDKAIGTSSAGIQLAVPQADDMVRRSDESRPELAALKAEVAQAEKAVVIAEADYYPSVAVGAAYQRQNQDLGQVFGDPSNNYFASINLIVQYNLFEGRANQARVEEAEINLRKSLAKRAELLRNVHSEVQDRLDNLKVQMELHDLALQTIEAAQEAVRLARGLYEQGKGTLLEQRDAELRLTQAKINAQTVRLQMEIARQELHRAVGEDPFAPRGDG